MGRRTAADRTDYSTFLLVSNSKKREKEREEKKLDVIRLAHTDDPTLNGYCLKPSRLAASGAWEGVGGPIFWREFSARRNRLIRSNRPTFFKSRIK
jgi:hypothetical protein